MVFHEGNGLHGGTVKGGDTKKADMMAQSSLWAVGDEPRADQCQDPCQAAVTKTAWAHGRSHM